MTRCRLRYRKLIPEPQSISIDHMVNNDRPFPFLKMTMGFLVSLYLPLVFLVESIALFLRPGEKTDKKSSSDRRQGEEHKSATTFAARGSHHQVFVCYLRDGRDVSHS